MNTELCACGCGKPISRSKRNNITQDHVKEGLRCFVLGHNRRKSYLDRFWEKVDKSDINGCWLWTASKDKDGYGSLSTDRGIEKAHRLSWRLHFGGIPKNMCVCHKCDNPSCVNPQHLFLGTNLDNVADRTNKDRGVRGSSCHTSKLTDVQIIEIRRRYANGEKQITLAKEFGVVKQAISAIITRSVWKHI